ncbi:MAG: cysteine synthase family protein [Acidobacteria bacterium]|nr:MAG: cysteine synthase family protein [Acidobacteriota bacterium]REK00486.1 MAG: cysteine synthase family protein [Acidobacteriota bacterium]
MEIYDDILETLGNTPLVRLARLHEAGNVVAKVESFNPGSSVKDRIGIEMIDAAEASGELQPGGLIVEPTSGNTGLGLAMVAALRGYRLICTAADKIPKEKVALLEAFGVEVITCPTDVEPTDPRSYYKVAERIRDERGAFLPYQYYNQSNPMAHYKTTGPEIWRQTDGEITHWVAGMGTGGTISGTAKYLKEQNPEVRVVGVDPVGSVYEHYSKHGELPPAEKIHGYLIDGIGEDFMPTAVWWDYIDEVITIDDRTAYQTVLDLSRREAIFSGSSGGAAVAGALQIADRDLADGSGLVVTLLPDSGERYLSKLNQKWLQERSLL